jgi:hypothetical protein
VRRTGVARTHGHVLLPSEPRRDRLRCAPSRCIRQRRSDAATTELRSGACVVPD